MKKAITPEQKRAGTDVTIILLTSLAVFVLYVVFQTPVMGFVRGNAPLLLRVLFMAFFQFGLAGLGMTVVCIVRRESFGSHGLHAKGAIAAVALSFLCFVPSLVYRVATGGFVGYLPFQGVNLTAEVLAAGFPLNVLGMVPIATAWGFFEGFNYVVLADKINKRYPTKNMWLNWGAIACAVFCILIHGGVGVTPDGILEMLCTFIIIYGMLVVRAQTGNAWGCVFVFLFLWNAF